MTGTVGRLRRSDKLPETTVMLADAALTVLGAKRRDAMRCTDNLSHCIVVANDD